MSEEVTAPFIGPIRENEYRCAQCGGVFGFAIDDDEARKASEEEWAMPVQDDTHDIICDDCYQEFKRAFDAGEILLGEGGAGDA